MSPFLVLAYLIHKLTAEFCTVKVNSDTYFKLFALNSTREDRCESMKCCEIEEITLTLDGHCWLRRLFFEIEEQTFLLCCLIYTNCLRVYFSYVGFSERPICDGNVSWTRSLCKTLMVIDLIPLRVRSEALFTSARKVEIQFSEQCQTLNLR